MAEYNEDESSLFPPLHEPGTHAPPGPDAQPKVPSLSGSRVASGRNKFGGRVSWTLNDGGHDETAASGASTSGSAPLGPIPSGEVVLFEHDFHNSHSDSPASGSGAAAAWGADRTDKVRRCKLTSA